MILEVIKLIVYSIQAILNLAIIIYLAKDIKKNKKL